MVYCEINKKYYKSYIGMANFLRKKKITMKEYYDKYLKKDTEGVCYCGNHTTFKSAKVGYKKYCSDICALKSDEHKKSVRERFLNDEDKKNNAILKREATIKSNGGYFKSINKRRKTILEKCKKLGISESEYYSNHSKKAAKSVKKNEKVKQTIKSMETKSSLSVKGNSYKNFYINGEIFKVQGYEPVVLNHLIMNYNFNTENMFIGKNNKVIIKYFDEKNIERMYFPDIYLPELNLLIEVKSEWTYHTDIISINNKIKYSIDNYSILLIVVTRDEFKNNKLSQRNSELINKAISSQESYRNLKIVYD